MSDQTTEPLHNANPDLAQRDAPPAPLRFSLRSVLILVTVCAVFLGLGVPIANRINAAERAARIANEFKSIQLGILNFVSAKKVLPQSELHYRNGLPLNSWRFYVFPFLDQLDREGDVRFDITAAWDAPIHAALRKYPTAYGLRNPGHDETTNVFGIAGPDAAFDPVQPLQESNCPGDLVVLLEVADSKTHWMQPGDYDVTTLLSYTGRLGDNVHGVLPDRIHVSFADGRVWALNPNAPIAALQPFLTVTGARANDCEKILGPYRVN